MSNISSKYSLAQLDLCHKSFLSNTQIYDKGILYLSTVFIALLIIRSVNGMFPLIPVCMFAASIANILVSMQLSQVALAAAIDVIYKHLAEIEVDLSAQKKLDKMKSVVSFVNSMSGIVFIAAIASMIVFLRCS